MLTFIEELRNLALTSLPRMYRPDQGLFAFRLRRENGKDVLEGISRRYTAMALIGLAGEPEAAAREAMGGQSCDEMCERLIQDLPSVENFGDVAATLWAARILGHGGTARAVERLLQLDPVSGPHPTVQIAWALTGLTAPPRPGGSGLMEPELAELIAARLLTCFNQSTGIFSHEPPDLGGHWWRRHVACFADLVYPTIALSHFGTVAGNRAALDAARACSDRTVSLQGPAGQWWWHYDTRTGRVIEKYPVYAVHQDGMAPMMLFAAGQACGIDYGTAIERGLAWLQASPENSDGLVDRAAGVIWRKIGRHEPGKLSRSLQAGVSAVHAGCRFPWMDRLMPPGRIDFESRPYHMGWLLAVSRQPRGGKHDKHERIVADTSSV